MTRRTFLQHVLTTAAATSAPIDTILAAPTLTDLKNVDELRESFNRDRGKLRLLLLLSPT